MQDRSSETVCYDLNTDMATLFVWIALGCIALLLFGIAIRLGMITNWIAKSAEPPIDPQQWKEMCFVTVEAYYKGKGLPPPSREEVNKGREALISQRAVEFILRSKKILRPDGTRVNTKAL